MPVHVDTDRVGEHLVNRRLAYVAVSRGRHDAQIYTNDKTRLSLLRRFAAVPLLHFNQLLPECRRSALPK